MDNRSITPGDFDVRPYRGPRRRVCLLTALRPERGLSLALPRHLSSEMPSIEFTLEPRDDVSAVWLCGYEQGSTALIGRLRTQYPEALILVTGREPEDEWASEAVEAGADFSMAWPVAYGRLEHLLGGRSHVLSPRSGDTSSSEPRARTAN